MSTAAVAEVSGRLLTLMKEPVVPDVGVHPGTPSGVYHSWHAASNSRLSKLRRSPAHLKSYMERGDSDTAALATGRAVHSAVLEPDDFAARYIVASQCGATKKGDGLRCTNAGKVFSEKDGWLCDVHSKGAIADRSRSVLSAADHAVCLAVRDAVHGHSRAHGMVTGSGQVELSMVWDEPESGVRCKARQDRHSPDLPGGVIVDLKTTRNASPRAFEKSIFEHGYHRQGALYLSGAQTLGLSARHFVIIAVEKEPPFNVAVYRLTEGALDAGAEQLRPLLAKYAECVQTDQWPGYPDTVMDIALPDWAWDQIDEEVTNE